MLTKMTKGRQVSIPAELRKKLEIEDGTLLVWDVNAKKDALILKPVKTGTLSELFKEADGIKNKTKKSVKGILKEYDEQMLH